MELLSIKKYIITNRNLDDKTVCFNKMSKDDFYTLEGVNKVDGQEEKYLIYDCSKKNQTFDFDLFDKIVSEDVDSIRVIIFENWENEINQYFNCYDYLNRNDKKKLSEYFDNKMSIYTQLCNSVCLYIDDPENFNEYIINVEKDFNNKLGMDNEKHKTLEGYIYNLSLYELKKLYNVTGQELFKKNVRKGTKNNSTVKEIKESFKQYLYCYVFEESRKLFNIDAKEELDTLMSDLEIDEAIISYNLPKFFWFNHNGITVFSFDDLGIDRSGCYIKFNPQKVSVINGAQTLTNFYIVLEEARRRLPSLYDKYDNKKAILNLLDDAQKLTIVKTIFIQGNEKYVKPSTYGLNKQIPVLGEHILADSEEVQLLNQILKKANLEIVKEGDKSLYGEGFNVLDFVKKVLIIDKKPGKSKNLRKAELKNIISESLEKFKQNEKFYLAGMNLLMNVDLWWKQSKKQREVISDNEDLHVINSYGKNYFESYLIEKSKDDKNIFDYDNQLLEIQYLEFLNDICCLKSNLDPADFKKDTLFDRYLENYTKKEERSLGEIDCLELKTYLNKNIETPYSVSKIIKDYLKSKEKDLQYFRVISREDGKCKEAYPFPNSCFNEIYSDDTINDIKYLDSKFKKEIDRCFPVFVLEYKRNEKSIHEIEYFGDFSFKDHDNCAKFVYEKTIEAFKKGDTFLLPKIKDNIEFHVRTKATDGNDTFEFTNGERITKRTFWANKSTVELIIDSKTK